MPALHYIAVVASWCWRRWQVSCADAGFRNRQSKNCGKINAIVFLDIQVGFSDLQTEVPYFEKYLKFNVHLGIDADFP